MQHAAMLLAIGQGELSEQTWTLGQGPAVVARQLEAVTAQERAEIIAEKLAKVPAPSRGVNDTLLQLQPRARWHDWTFPAVHNHPRCAQQAFKRGMFKKERKKDISKQ